MKKNMVASILLISTSMFASNDMFVGIELGNTKATFKASVPAIDYSLSDTDDGGHQGIKIGKFLNDNFRIGFSIFNYNSEANTDVSSWAIGADYVVGNDKLKPFVGMHLANFDYTITGMKGSGYDKDSISASDTALGFHFGGLYTIDEKFDFEIGYRLTRINASGSNSITRNGTVYAVDFKIEDAKAYYFGLNYKF